MSSADELRTLLLERLAAEPEWRFGDGDGEPSIVHWMSGPCATSFVVRAGAGGRPGSVLDVFTLLGEVHDLELARTNVELLDIHTTLNRWVIVGDPGPEGWSAVGSAVVDEATAARMAALVHRSPALRRPQVVCAASFVVGGDVPEVPPEVVELTVREQVATVTALASSGVPELWGAPSVAQLPDGRSRTGADDWHDVVLHFDRQRPPSEADAPALMDALIDAFNVHVSQQTSSGGPFWLGAAGADGFVCEVPYGAGPFPDGAVWAANPGRRPGDETTATSLVEAHVVENPHAGDGLLVTMRLPVACPPEHRGVAWTAALLNEQASLTAPGITHGSAHGIGAWVETDGDLGYRCFLPATWFNGADGIDPRPLLYVLLANCALLSTNARHVLEFDPLRTMALLDAEDLAAQADPADQRNR